MSPDPSLINRLSKFTQGELDAFLRLDVLSERLFASKRSAVGRHERAFFDSAFKVLIDEKFNVPSMEALWRV
jgi:hypothetical protein